jgi:hypothetical protein
VMWERVRYVFRGDVKRDVLCAVCTFSICFTLGDGAGQGMRWASSGRSLWAGRASDFFYMRREPIGEVA